MDSILLLALSASMVAKTLVDMLRMAVDTPRWLPPVLAVGAGVGTVLLLMVAQGQALTAAALATAVLAGVLAGGSSVGVTELSNRANVLTQARREWTGDVRG